MLRLPACSTALFPLLGFASSLFGQGAEPLPAAVNALPGFKVELIHRVPSGDQGSWVALTLDDKGRMLASDQYGGLYRFALPGLDGASVPSIEKLDTQGLGGAHGLLYAHGSLYAMVNERSANKFGEGKSGLYRLRDTDGNDTFDQIELLREMDGSGEHGTHDLVLGPDGKMLYYVNGNFTDLPPGLEKSLPKAYGEDHIIPRMWDARGHARGRLAPGGWVARTDADGRTHELFAMGFRNSYRVAFDPNGELFTFDSDMEWDQGTPWYMPTRINHVVSAGDYGWRSGAGRWPDYYADSLPAVVDIGPGSPTGATMGTGARFPARYQNALYAADWTFGTLYAVHLEPDGASFKAKAEEFVWGRPLPLTDVLINPADGAMYFAVGGRRGESALYRVTYTGTESTAPAAYPAPTPEARLRRQLEALHADDAGPGAIAQAWPHLASRDRFVRWAARAVLERQPAEFWMARAFDETQPQAAIEALIALARVGNPDLLPRLVEALGRIDFGALDQDLQIQLVRAWQLAFTRMGPADAATKAVAVARLDRHFPHANPFISRELANLLIHADSPTVVAKAVPLLKVAEDPGSLDVAADTLLARNDRYGSSVAAMQRNRPDRQQIAYAYALRSARAGWTPELRTAFFSWFKTTHGWMGGLSFPGFIDNIRTIALAAITDPAERQRLADLSERPFDNPFADVTPPAGPGREYTIDEAVELVRGQLTGRNFERGRAMYAAASCIACHRLGNLGVNATGPNLTQAGSRYTERDLLMSIIHPTDSINETYLATQYEMKDGSIVVGYPVFDEGGELFVSANLFMPRDLTLVREADIKQQRPYPNSLMPSGLINGLNPDEVRDLIAFILAGGNRNNPMFAR